MAKEAWSSDDELVAKILGGDVEAFDLLYETYFPRVYRFALKRLRDPGEAEDVTQEVFLTVFHALKNYRGESNDTDLIQGEMALAKLADREGFDSYWAVEHHFFDYSMCPDNMQWLAQVAAVTERVKLGTGAVIVPWNDPYRIAAKMALLEKINDHFGPMREKRAELAADMDYVNDVLRNGAQKAAVLARETLSKARQAVGLE